MPSLCEVTKSSLPDLLRLNECHFFNATKAAPLT
jgi:hypothetical protein